MIDSELLIAKDVNGGSSATTLYSNPLLLGNDINSDAAGATVRPLTAEVLFPTAPTGTTPTCTATVQETLNGGSTYADLVAVATVTGTSAYPVLRKKNFVPSRGASAVRMKYVLGTNDNDFDVCTFYVTNGADGRNS